MGVCWLRFDIADARISFPSMDYSGKIALVTGANSGIGEAIAHRLASRGCTVIVNGRREKENERVVEALRSQYDARAEAWTADVADEGNCVQAIEKMFSDHGRLDILVNNAGIALNGLLLRFKDEDWRKVLAVNMSGAFTCARAAARHLLKAKERGRIIAIQQRLHEDDFAGFLIETATVSLGARRLGAAPEAQGRRGQ